MNKLVEQGLISRPIALPTEKTLQRLGWTIIVFLIKLDLTEAYRRPDRPLIWIEQGRIMKALTYYMQNEYDDFKIIFIGTPIGWRYDLVVFAYTKGISKGFSAFASKVTKLLPCLEVVTHPFASIYEFEPVPYARAEAVWNEVADLFDTYVTRTEIKPLLSYIQSEKFYLDKVIANCKGDCVSLVEIGSGTGRLLMRYLSKKQLLKEYADVNTDASIVEKFWNKLKIIVGVDCAEKMLEQTERNLEKHGLKQHLDNKLFLFKSRAEYLRYGVNHNLDDTKSRKLKQQGFWNHKRIVCNMLNTLGIMNPSIREDTLLEMKELAGPDGTIVLSVFDANYFTKGVEQIYTPLKGLVGDFSLGINVDHLTSVFTTEKGYYSHWFTEEEITNLVREVGLKISGRIQKNPEGFSMFLTLIPS